MMAESRERGFFGDVVIIHDRGGPRPAPPNLKPWRMCSTSDCEEMAVTRNGEEFSCGKHIKLIMSEPRGQGYSPSDFDHLKAD